MNNRQMEDRLAASPSSSIPQVISTPDRSVSKKTPKVSITPNTVVVICAIAALIAILVLLESHIRSLSVHAASHHGVLLDPVPFRDRTSTISSSERRSSPNTIRHFSFHQP